MEDEESRSPATPERLSALYKREIEPWLRKHESARLEVVRRTILVAAVGVVVTICWIWFAESRSLDSRLASAGAKMIFLVFFIATILVRARLRSKLKNLIVTKLTDLHGFEFIGLPPRDWLRPFHDLQLLPSFDSRAIEDRITGKIGQVVFDMAEANLLRRVGRSSSLVFRGLLIRVPSPRDVVGPILIRPGASAIEGGSSPESRPGKPVYIDDPDFEDRFEVRAMDMEEAVGVLDLAFRLMLADLCRGIGRLVAVGLYRNELFLVMPRSKDSFEPGSLFQPLPDPARLEAVADDIDVIYQVVGALNLHPLYPTAPPPELPSLPS